jgi:hypothetical protein
MYGPVLFVVSSAGHMSIGHEFVIVTERLFGILESDGGGGIKFEGGGVAFPDAAGKSAVVAVVGVWSWPVTGRQTRRGSTMCIIISF